ncbi:MAG: hypothetical protein HQ485_16905 [Acidobacteria bacterium]|nr:hypothetical protein [Acidobacteriota bacterium]
MAVRLFVGNMPYGATEADLRTHFGSVGDPSQVVLPVDRDTGRPRGFAFVEYLERDKAEEAIKHFDQQPFMGRSLSVSEARPREERPPGGFAPRPAGGGFSPRPPGEGFSPRPGGGGFRPGGPPAAGNHNFGPPKKKSTGWDNKDRGPKGPLKERFSGRLGGLYDAPDDEPIVLPDFDDPAATAAKDDDE